ncbi:hypothetical protein TCAL_07084 [Tigriopus californicus]|uniref:Uracil phosphoribosyltransferase homolog n=1 Tax=Tigriopus californicus TaxID=6832 RepID=A0A553PQE9_TIGCA|nr:hypothetical protein TCAL_07084 [Tigriopus californicus]
MASVGEPVNGPVSTPDPSPSSSPVGQVHGQALGSKFKVLPRTDQIHELQTLIRSAETSRSNFKFVADRLIRMVIEEGLNQLPYSEVEVVTPTGKPYQGLKYEKGNCGVSIVRSGEAMEKALQECCRSMRIGKILVDSEPEKNDARVVFAKLPSDIAKRKVLLLYPIMSSGNKVCQAMKVLKDHGVPESHVFLINLFCTPEAGERIVGEFPALTILTTEVHHVTPNHFGQKALLVLDLAKAMMASPHDWAVLPPELLVNIARKLELSQMCCFSLVCRSWYLAINDNNVFWRQMLCQVFKTSQIPVHAFSEPKPDWKAELFRLTNKVPSVNTQTLTAHKDEVLFVSFSHNYGDFVSCSKDRSFIIWRYNKKSHEFENFNTIDMARYNWLYIWSGQYSSDDKKLLISGVMDSLNGEIAIYNTMSNDPLARAVNVVLFICDYQPISPSELWNRSPEDEAQLLSVENCIGRVFDYRNTSAFQYLRLIRVFSQKKHDPSKKFPMEQRNPDPGRHILQEDQLIGPECEEVLRKNQLCLVAMYGSKTTVPHKIGFRDLTLDSVICPKRIADFDHSIEFHGQIVSISCAKDDLQMFVAVREWPENAVATLSDPPPISTEVIVYAVDLQSWSLTGQVFKGAIGRTSPYDAFYLYTDSSANFLACGSEDGRGVIWDRLTGLKLSTLDHEQCLNCVSFRVDDEEVCVTSSDDHTIKVWKSKDRVKREMSEILFD